MASEPADAGVPGGGGGEGGGGGGAVTVYVVVCLDRVFRWREDMGG
jgi:hypothetical protein